MQKDSALPPKFKIQVTPTADDVVCTLEKHHHHHSKSESSIRSLDRNSWMLIRIAELPSLTEATLFSTKVRQIVLLFVCLVVKGNSQLCMRRSAHTSGLQVHQPYPPTLASALTFSSNALSHIFHRRMLRAIRAM